MSDSEAVQELELVIDENSDCFRTSGNPVKEDVWHALPWGGRYMIRNTSAHVYPLGPPTYTTEVVWESVTETVQPSVIKPEWKDRGGVVFTPEGVTEIEEENPDPPKVSQGPLSGKMPGLGMD